MKNILLLFILILPINIYALEIDDLNSKSAIVYDIDADDIIYEKNSTEIRSIASLTKIMTVITAIENIDDLNDTITITKDMLSCIYWNASVAGLKVGDTVTYLDLLYASILPSGADATQALAYAISGNVNNFVFKMNELAKKIGANNTNYVNTTGLDENGAYSNAYDQLLILKYALSNSVFKSIYTTRNYTLSNGLEVEATINLYNRLLNLDTSAIIGSKTGNTNNAGLCMSALFTHENHNIIFITLGAEAIEDIPYNLIDALNIIDNVNQNYTFVKEESVVASINNNVVLITNNINYNTIIFLIIMFFLISGFLFKRIRK